MLVAAVYLFYGQILFLVEPDRKSESKVELLKRSSLEEQRPELEQLLQEMFLLSMELWKSNIR